MKKINKILRNFAFASSFLLLSSNLISCSSKNEIYLANFENYMSEDLQSILKDSHTNLNFRSYGTNEDLERNFKSNYDMAIPSTYLIAKMANNGLLEKIDWSRFGLKKLDENGNQTNQPILDAEDALTLFTDNVQKILTEVYVLNGNPPGGLLNYCVPYFMQDFIFSYKDVGNKYKNDVLNCDTWEKTIDFVAPKIGQNNPFNRIAMIDDFRSIYSIPRLIETNNKTVNPISIDDSGKNIIHSIDEFKTTYSYLSNKFMEKENSFLLNSDSNTILNNFANLKGSDSGIMYNGDVLYAFQGGDNYSSYDSFIYWLKNYFNNNDFGLKIIRPSTTLTALDGMVINKNSKNKDECYQIIKKICLEGSDISIYQNNQQDYNPNSIIQTDAFGSYIYGPMINFDYVQYSSPLKNINSFVVQNDVHKGYFAYKYSYLLEEKILNNEQYSNYINSLISVYNISSASVNNTLEQNLSDINKSNMYYAFQEIRTRL